MAIITGISAQLHRLGTAPYSRCKYCTQAGLTLYETSLTPKLLYLPTVKLRRKVLATCPRCHQTMQVTKKKAKEARRDLRTLLLPDDFEEPDDAAFIDVSICKNNKKERNI